MMARDPFGFGRAFYAGESWAPTLRGLIEAHPELPRELDHVYLDGHLGGDPPLDRSLFASVRALPPGPLPEARPGALLPILKESIANSIAGRRAAVLLSGGLDSAIVAALASELPAYVLSTNLPHYDELKGALASARGLGMDVKVIEADEEDFVASLPETIRLIETPLYNLHPVAKLLMARALAADGIEVALSGDGADQVLSRDTSADYLPLVKALFDGARVELRSPFLEDEFVAASPLDPAKQCLRQLAESLGIREELVHAPKRASWAPPMDLSRYADPRLQRLLGRAPPVDERGRVTWITEGLLIDAFGGW